MSVYRGPYVSLDLNEGVWLDLERDEFGNTKCWMTIEGEEIELTQKQYDAMMKGRAEAYKAVAEAERERIIQLLEKQNRRDFQDSMTDENYAETAIALIKGDQPSDTMLATANTTGANVTDNEHKGEQK